MLTKSDTDVVKTWLKLALETGAKHGLSAKELATRCSVTVQAVNGWLSTGRITKKNLELATIYFGHGPSFTDAGGKAREAPLNPWPFRRIRVEEIRALKPAQLQRLEKMLRDRLDEWAEDAASAAPSNTGKRRTG